MTTEIHPVLLDKLYHWAEIGSETPVQVETVSADTIIVSQGDRHELLSLKEQPDRFFTTADFKWQPHSGGELFIGDTFGAGWPD